eukprot:GEMP01089679.1.p2 GENE.GEMP01089679.1~~GEMP01089679.1.p2  ORF type:complete len:145 (-),score=15.94 GEMP01089679.1:335-769(-)
MTRAPLRSVQRMAIVDIFLKPAVDCFQTLASSNTSSLVYGNAPSLSKINFERAMQDSVLCIAKMVRINPCDDIHLLYLSTRSILVNDGCIGLIPHVELTSWTLATGRASKISLLTTADSQPLEPLPSLKCRSFEIRSKSVLHCC